MYNVFASDLPPARVGPYSPGGLSREAADVQAGRTLSNEEYVEAVCARFTAERTA